MENQGETSATKILWDLYVKDDPERAAAIEFERINAEIAQLIYDRRTGAGLTQKQLAERVGTQQSVISRLEDADYDGHSLRILQRIASALGETLRVQMVPRDDDGDVVRYAFREMIRGLRRRQGLTLAALAEALHADADELAMLERGDGDPPTRRLLCKLSRFYGIPERTLAELAGIVPVENAELRQQALRFADDTASLTSLTVEERQAVDSFTNALTGEG